MLFEIAKIQSQEEVVELKSYVDFYCDILTHVGKVTKISFILTQLFSTNEQKEIIDRRQALFTILKQK